MEKEVISSPGAPKAVGPYSQAVRAGDWIYVSGQIPLDPETGRLVEGDIEIQTERALDNLREILEAAGSRLEKVVKVSVYLKDMEDFAAVNEVYGRFFPVKPPARACVEVSNLPKGAGIEIEAVALAE